MQKTDSGDSGNEEPNEETDFYVKPETRDVVADRVYVATAPKVDRLAERINNLSCPRDYHTERVPDGLVDSLPPEGMYGGEEGERCPTAWWTPCLLRVCMGGGGVPDGLVDSLPPEGMYGKGRGARRPGGLPAI